jgi:multiple sugar transport system ATP-binding protein
MARVAMRGLNKMYDEVHAVIDVNLEIRDQEFVVLVGPSGCGKTTTLRMVAGLESITGGQISIDEKVVNELPPMDRDIAMVFQNYALYPHMTVYKNMAFGLMLRKYPKAEIDQRVREAAQILGITDEQLERKPKALSGGQRQRVALARALLADPAVLLLDEPTSGLDHATASRLLHDVLATTSGKSILYITHRLEEVTAFDLVVDLQDGLSRPMSDAPKCLEENLVPPH